MTDIVSFLGSISYDCKVRASYPYDDKEDMRACLIKTAAKLETLVAFLDHADRTLAVPLFAENRITLLDGPEQRAVQDAIAATASELYDKAYNLTTPSIAKAKGEQP